MSQSSQPIPIHCYTNPSFCQQSEYTHNDHIDDLPPPPPQQFQTDELPPPPPPTPPSTINNGAIIQIQNQQTEPVNYQTHYTHTNPTFQTRQDINNCIELDTRVRYAKTPDRYCYVDDGHVKNINNIETQNRERRINYERNNRSRYEFIDDDDEPVPLQQPIQLQRRASLTRIETVNHRQNLQFHRQASYHGQRMQTMLSVPVNRVDNDINNQQKLHKLRQDDNNVVRYALVPADEAITDGDSSSWINTNYSSPRGRYARLPMQDEEPPILPDRNLREQIELRENIGSSRNNIATQKLHEILTTPRKPRSKSEERNLSPGRRTPQRGLQYATPPASTTASPTGRVIVAGTSRRGTPSGTPQRAFSPGRVPQTSTPNKEIPPARRCLPLNEQQELCPASNCGRSRYTSRHQDGTVSLAASPIEFTSKYNELPPPRYAYVESTSESLPMVIGSTKYQVLPSRNESTQKRPYDSVENAFIARTAVVPPLSPPNSEANTTFASGLDKGDRKSAPLILVLVGILTCGLAFYLSWTQGRRYYFDSAAGCGICCALAGASRSLRRTWTGFSLAGLATLSCAGLLLIAIKSPRSGSPLHDITAGVLCGVSLLGAGLAILALMSPKCNFGRHRRVHSWIPQFAP